MFIFNAKKDNTKKKYVCLWAIGDLLKKRTRGKKALVNTVYHQALIAGLTYILDHEKIIGRLDISSVYLDVELEEDPYVRSFTVDVVTRYNTNMEQVSIPVTTK